MVPIKLLNEEESTDKLIQFAQYTDFGKMSIDECIKAMDVGIPKN